MKRFVNVRFPVLIVLSLIAGILVGFLFIKNSVNIIYIIIVVPLAAAIFILCVVLSCKKTLIFSLTAISFFLAGAASCYFRLDGYGTKELVNGDLYTIEATVCEKGLTDSGEYIFVGAVTADGEKVGGRIKVYLSSSYGDFCDVGYRVNFSAKIYCLDTFPYGELNYNATADTKYRCTVYGGLSAVKKFSLFGSINGAVRKTLQSNLDSDTASVVYAMLTGNTDGIEEGSLSAFRFGGVAHIFAVSGLHIGIIYGLLRIFCKKFRLGGYGSFAVCIIPLILYSGVCGFTPSSVRALIMCAVAAAARLAYSKYDALNALSLSATTILLINPLYLFGVGFQLSVCAVAGIILLGRQITRPFRRVPRKIKDAVGVSLSAQAGTAPVMLARFGYLSGAGLLLNILIVPVLSALFTVIFILTLLSLIIPFAANYLLPFAATPLELVISVLTDAGFERSLISGFGAGAFIAIYYALILLSSDKLNIALKKRIVCIACALAVLCAYVPVKTFYPFKGYKIVVSAYYGGGEVLFKNKDGNVLVVTQSLNLSRVDALLNKYYSSNLSALIILGGENCASVYGKTDFRCDAYIYDKYLNLQPFSNKKIKYESNFTLNGINFEFTDGYSLFADCSGFTVGICAGEYIPYRYCDILATDSLDSFNANTLISFNERNYDNCIYDDGDFTFLIK